MKYKNLILTVAALLLVAYACSNSDDATEPEDATAAAEMTQSLLRMGAENDSLVIHHTGHMYHHHDSIYHHHDSIYIHYHHDYHHGDTIHHHADGLHNENQHHHYDSISAAHHNIAH